MGLGTSIVLIAVGAILKYAVTFDVVGIDIQVVGTILLIIGILGLVISVIYMFMSRGRTGSGDRPPSDRTAVQDRDRDRY